MSESNQNQNLKRDDAWIPPKSRWQRLPLVAWIIGLAGIVGTVALASSEPQQLFSSYLFAFTFTLSFALGGMFFVLVHYAARAGWSVVVRRIAENAMATIPLFGILFIPIAIWGIPTLFEWADPHEQDALIAGKSGYLNTSFFLVRAVIYFAVWILISWYFRSRSLRQDRSGDQRITRRLQFASPPALIGFAVTLTFAAFDWLMSLDPHWYSTIFGVYYFAGSTVCIYAFISIVSISLRWSGILDEVVTAEHYHDLGKLLFAFTVFWTYIAFSQYMLIWYANIPEETRWFLERWHGSFRAISLLLAIGHFAIPFFFLMSRHIKRRPALLLAASVWMILMHMADIYWLVMPVFHGGHGHTTTPFSVVDLTALIGVGGLFVAVFAWYLKRSPLIPLRDPRLPESLAFENF